MNSLKAIVESIMPRLEHLSERQKRVLQSAVILFSEQGYDKTTTKDIAQHAQVAEGTVFKHFKNKQTLLYAGLIPILKNNVIPVALTEFKTELTLTNDLKTFIDKFVDNRSQFIYDNRVLIKVLLNEALTSVQLQTIVINLFTENLLAQLTPLLQKLIDQGYMRDVNKEYAIRTIVAQTFNLNLPMIIDANKSRDKAFDEFATFVKDSLYYSLKV
ncbi:TetR/AcrR family transcriptional regulator [Staphylococcus arlettae]|uniref:TetR family transcriptional regulator n=1 Tax=Staphylococcus arlettae TaxID=29378 RepID=A0A380C0W3_9STAP|nr:MULTISPECIES: TetR/AcrR family transcriptional regulator [Staphylococcus]ERF48245.1 TetR family transcriptional regulator [Staphylococcus sp. EGD-HP3]KAB2477902.1 TetR/AcrR family transcriptional regulator [Staphylococcus sp. CH99b_3]MCD8815803.1 TetR/AcrR family transcriptional regulator [Staphylococcus arlettae]MCD8838864.1 TetR/AcrR family transcriptional regulator [Staphylococcus arlettae]MCD8842141.1 TetR/AcrR family transcriptional regulator [Staphylococcus arlettae]